MTLKTAVMACSVSESRRNSIPTRMPRDIIGDAFFIWPSRRTFTQLPSPGRFTDTSRPTRSEGFGGRS